MSTNELLATLNATLNATSAVLAIFGWRAIKNGKQIDKHRGRMLAAFMASSIFLAGYLARMTFFGDTRFAGSGAWKVFYLALLASHVLLAIVATPLVLRTLYLGLRKRFADHLKLARVTFMLWTYVSITGVLVYVLLWRIPWA